MTTGRINQVTIIFNFSVASLFPFERKINSSKRKQTLGKIQKHFSPDGKNISVFFVQKL